jgi:hypothetical protein
MTLNRQRVQEGLAPYASQNEVWEGRREAGHGGRRLLVNTAFGFDYAQKVSPLVTYTGPILPPQYVSSGHERSKLFYHAARGPPDAATRLGQERLLALGVGEEMDGDDAGSKSNKEGKGSLGKKNKNKNKSNGKKKKKKKKKKKRRREKKRKDDSSSSSSSISGEKAAQQLQDAALQRIEQQRVREKQLAAELVAEAAADADADADADAGADTAAEKAMRMEYAAAHSLPPPIDHWLHGSSSSSASASSAQAAAGVGGAGALYLTLGSMAQVCGSDMWYM